jgi:hypothetical protein
VKNCRKIVVFQVKLGFPISSAVSAVIGILKTIQAGQKTGLNRLTAGTLKL